MSIMLKLIYTLTSILERRRSRSVPDPLAWWSDPLSHPDLATMSADQLADLPFPTTRRAGDPVKTTTPQPCHDLAA